MKKLALAICLLLASIAAQAQFEKGTMILNPSVTGLDFSVWLTSVLRGNR